MSRKRGGASDGEEAIAMRVCIYGAGAGGGHIAVRLARTGHDVSVVARGPHLEAIRRDGLRLLRGEEEWLARPRASDRPEELGRQDVVLVTVKATALNDVAEGIGALIDDTTRVVFCQNGMQWWYRLGEDAGRLPDLPVFRLADRFLSVMRPQQVLGGLLYTANEVREPGVVLNTSPRFNRICFDAAAGADAAAVAELRATFLQTGMECPPVDDIRRQVWRKLLFNMSGSVLALATLNRSIICRQDPELAETFTRIVEEGLAIAEAYGHPLRTELIPSRMLETMNDHKPSLLQDYERGRSMELAEIVLAPLEMARAAGVSAPVLQALGAVTCRLARDRGLF